MDTSVTERMVMIVILIGVAWIIAYENLRLLVLLLLKRKVSLTTKILWPAMGLVLIGCAVDAFRVEPNWVQLTKHEITTPKLPKGSRLRIVQLSDTHMYSFDGRIQKAIRLTASQQPDIIVLTGDYLNSRSPLAMAALERFSKELVKIAPTYAVEGNWDDYKVMETLIKSGVSLVNQWTTIPVKKHGEIALGKLWWGLNVTPGSIPPDMQKKYQVLLCHTPNNYPSAYMEGVDLMISGHTHGGQVRIPIFGALVPSRKLVGSYQAGMYERGNSRLYVSRGIGMEGAAPQVRFDCRPEVAVIDIRGE